MTTSQQPPTDQYRLDLDKPEIAPDTNRPPSRIIKLNAMRKDSIVAAINAAVPAAEHQEGHRTRAGLSPRLAAQHLAALASANGDRACIVTRDEGSVLAVRFRQGAKTTEPWEACVVAGHPDDTSYREAHDTLFDQGPRPEPERARPLEPAPLPCPKEPRPTPDGWAISRWFTCRWQRVARSHRVVVPRYEDYLRPDPPGSNRGAEIIRLAEPHE